MSKKLNIFFILGNCELAFEDCNLPKWTMSIQSIDAPVRILKIFQKI